MMEFSLLPIVIVVLVIVFFISTIKVVPQTSEYIVERLGKFHAKWGAGIHIKLPIIDNVVSKVSLKEQVLDFPPQPVITKDNVTMGIDSVVFIRVFDSQLFTYGVNNPIEGIQSLAATTLRNLVGAMDFDETLTSRETINASMQVQLDEATDAWGVKVIRVEVKNITPPRDIQEVMTKQMTAEREKRQAILEAEAHQKSIVMRAEGDKQAKVLAAEAERDAQIALATGKAESIRLVYEAEAEGIRKLNESEPSAAALKLKSIEAMKDIANGNSTKIFMPTDIMDSVASLGVIGESLGVGAHTATKTKQKQQVKQPVDACLHNGSSKVSKGAAKQGFETRMQMEQRRDM